MLRAFTPPKVQTFNTSASLQERAQQLIDAGLQPIPMKGKHVPTGDTAETRYGASAFAGKVDSIQIRTGLQDNGMYLNAIDIDQHKEYQDAEAYRERIIKTLGLDAERVKWAPSPNGGHHGAFWSTKPIKSQRIYDADGRHAGELMGDGGRCRVPDAMPLILDLATLDRLLNALYLRSDVTPVTGTTDRKTAIRGGLRMVRGWEEVRTPDVRAFLVAGLKHHKDGIRKAAGDLLERFDNGEGDRSEWLSDFIQHAMFRANELGSGTTERLQRVMALAVKSDALGKGSEKGYKIVNDSAAIIYRISIGAVKLNGKHYTIPFWLKQAATSAPAPEPQPEPEPTPKAPGRPEGDRSAQLAKFKRLLQRLAVDDVVSGYTVEYFAEQLGVKRRSVQNYLKALKKAGFIAAGQADGNGRLVIILLNRGANNSSQAVQTATKRAGVWGANENAECSIPTQETGESASNGIRKEDHQNLAPRPETPAAPLVAADNAPDESHSAHDEHGATLPGSDAVGVQRPGDPLEKRPARSVTLRTPHSLERHELTTRRAIETMRNTDAYEPTEADRERSARRQRSAPIADDWTQADYAGLEAVLTFGTQPTPQRLPNRAERLAADGWQRERSADGYRFIHAHHGATQWHSYPFPAMLEAEQHAAGITSTA